MITIFYGQTRIMFAMSRDGLVPEWLAEVNPWTGTPVRLTILFGIGIAVLAAIVPFIGIGLCVYLMWGLPLVTWIRFFLWLAVGMLIYVFYSYRHSRLRRIALGAVPSAAPTEQR
jgi:APA family basic amino acid/polyamine antiporter